MLIDSIRAHETFEAEANAWESVYSELSNYFMIQTNTHFSCSSKLSTDGHSGNSVYVRRRYVEVPVAQRDDGALCLI